MIFAKLDLVSDGLLAQCEETIGGDLYSTSEHNRHKVEEVRGKESNRIQGRGGLLLHPQVDSMTKASHKNLEII